MKAKSKPMPSLRSDVDAEHFVDSAGLSQYDLSGFQPMSFESEPKSAALAMRLPAPLLEALKRKAQAPRYSAHALCAATAGKGRGAVRSRP